MVVSNAIYGDFGVEHTDGFGNLLRKESLKYTKLAFKFGDAALCIECSSDVAYVTLRISLIHSAIF